MTKKIYLYASIFLILILQGCLGPTDSAFEKEVKQADKAIEAYLESNNIDAAEQSTGVYIEVLEENEDGMQVLEDHVVGILYKMIHLEGGHEIESYTDTTNPLRFSFNYDLNYNGIHPAGLN